MTTATASRAAKTGKGRTAGRSEVAGNGTAGRKSKMSCGSAADRCMEARHQADDQEIAAKLLGGHMGARLVAQLLEGFIMATAVLANDDRGQAAKAWRKVWTAIQKRLPLMIVRLGIGDPS